MCVCVLRIIYKCINAINLYICFKLCACIDLLFISKLPDSSFSFSKRTATHTSQIKNEVILL